MASDIWLRTILIVREETRCRHIGYSFRLAARVLLYAPSHRQDSTYHGLCYTSRGALAGTRNSSMGPPPSDSEFRRSLSEWFVPIWTLYVWCVYVCGVCVYVLCVYVGVCVVLCMCCVCMCLCVIKLNFTFLSLILTKYKLYVLTREHLV